MTDLAFIPRNQLVASLHNGWRLIPGHEYSVDEYAILMALCPDVEPPVQGMVDFVVDMFTHKPPEVRLRNCDKHSCINGHRYTVENSYITPNGWRQCRICRRASRKAARNREKWLALA